MSSLRPHAAVAIGTVCALIACFCGLSGASAAVPATPAAVITAPALEGSPFATRLLHHQREARSQGWAADGSDDPRLPIGPGLGINAADYAHVVATKWQLKHQDITVALDPKTQRLDVHVVATISTAEKDVDELVLRTDIMQAPVVKAADGATLKSTYKPYPGGVASLEIALPAPLTPDVDTQLDVSYYAILDCEAGGYMLRPCSFDNEFSTVAFYRYYLAHAESARHPFTSNLYVLTPADEVAAAPGIPHPAVKQADGRLKWRFEQPERTSNAGFSIGQYTISGDDPPAKPSPDSPFVRVYTLASYAPNGPTLTKLFKHILGFVGDRFGAYPWAGLNAIQLANNFGGGYAPLGASFMYKYVFGGKENGQGWTGLTELSAHELAHQWWGNYVRPATGNDTSLSESLAEFTSCLYGEKVLESREQIIGDNLSYVYTVQAKDDRPLGSVYAHSSPAYVPIMYHKGAVVMDMLRIELGDKPWLQALADFAQAFGRDYARWQDLRDAVAKSTGKDMDWYFKQWFAETGYIRAEITARVVQKGSKYTLKLRVAHLGKQPMRFRLPLRVYFPAGEYEDTTVEILPTKGTHLSIAELTFDKPVVGARPDRGRRLLRRFQLLTPGDVNLDGLSDGRDLIEMGFRMRRAILFKNKWGNERFIPNSSWDELYDVVPNHKIDEEDLDAVTNAIGTVAIDF